MTTIKHAEEEGISWLMATIVVGLVWSILWLAADIVRMLIEGV